MYFQEYLEHTIVVSKNNENGFLAHHGVPGQQWGKRRYQNEDGTLTEEGKAHYGVGEGNDGERSPAENSENTPKLTTSEMRENLGANYRNMMTQALWSNVVGRMYRISGNMLQRSGSSKVRMAGRFINALGSGFVWGSRFKAVASTGAYFLNKHMIDKAEQNEEKKRT